MVASAAPCPVAIVGGGPTGLALALTLQRQGIASSLFEARERGAGRRDARILALSHGSRQILDTLGVWAQLEATPIAAIHVSQRGSFGRTRLSAAEQALPALGYVVAAGSLCAALEQALDSAGVVFHDNTRVLRVDSESGSTSVRVHSREGETDAALVVYAEGGGTAADDPGVCVHDYAQSAVICTVDCVAPHHHVAYERFTDSGPLALLPCGKGYAVVYTCASAAAPALIELGDAEFLARLQAHFGTRLRFAAATPRQVYPLALRYRRSPIAQRAVWLGNAAQTLHPVAGQGFNLALRDVAELGRCLRGAIDPGDASVLRGYAAARRVDRIATLRSTDALARLFGLAWPLLPTLRGAGLLALDLVPPLRRFVARRMIFGARAF